MVCQWGMFRIILGGMMVVRGKRRNVNSHMSHVNSHLNSRMSHATVMISVMVTCHIHKSHVITYYIWKYIAAVKIMNE
jgi:hypothetical protein